uniref:Ras-associating domain-containing protein n=1 Tax=Chelonoidis abingdonii TaxID=106734 RepID=A0A8C0JCC6_CHEAB
MQGNHITPHEQKRNQNLPGTCPPPWTARPLHCLRPHPKPLLSGRKLKEEEPRASSLPSIPNPFPELCSPSKSPILSSPSAGQGPQRESGPHVVKVFSEDGTCRSLEVTAGATARHVCEMLVQKTHALHDDSWSLVELHQHLALGEEACTPPRGPCTAG